MPIITTTAIVECPNGDLLAIWYTCVQERGRELAVAASRLRYGAEEWEPASPFWDAPDRNDHCPALWFDGKQTLYHFNGLGVAGKWEPLAIIMRTSTDSGATWSKARLIVPEFGFRNMVGEPVFRTREGAIVFGADASEGSNIWVSRDNGASWTNPGGHINGIHAGIVQLNDGRLMALGRGQNVNGWMPMSISSDMGKTWHAVASPLPPITGGRCFWRPSPPISAVSSRSPRARGRPGTSPACLVQCRSTTARRGRCAALSPTESRITEWRRSTPDGCG